MFNFQVSFPFEDSKLTLVKSVQRTAALSCSASKTFEVFGFDKFPSIIIPENPTSRFTYFDGLYARYFSRYNFVQFADSQRYRRSTGSRVFTSPEKVPLPHCRFFYDKSNLLRSGQRILFFRKNGFKNYTILAQSDRDFFSLTRSFVTFSLFGACFSFFLFPDFFRFRIRHMSNSAVSRKVRYLFFVEYYSNLGCNFSPVFSVISAQFFSVNYQSLNANIISSFKISKYSKRSYHIALNLTKYATT